MILESIHIRNWRNLADVKVEGLSRAITVIHAPNKTGKTSMVEALRFTLIDLDYNTSRVGPVVPWGTNSIPAVTMEFNAGGYRYLLSKRFTKRKEGGAELHRVRNDGKPGELVAADKSVTGKTRELVGLEGSNRGLAQLLWLEQGVVDLPKIDADLDEALRPVLGSVVSGRDASFRQALWERMQLWFTSEINAARENHRKGSRFREVEELIAKREQEVADIDGEFTRIEDLLSEVERKEQQIAEAEALVDAASREVEVLKKADQELVGKRKKAGEIGGAVEGLKGHLSELEDALEKCREYAEGVGKLTGQLEDLQKEVDPLVNAEEAARQALKRATVAREKAERASNAMGGRRAIVDAMRRLVKIEEQMSAGEKALGTVQELEERIKKGETTISELDAPDKKQLSVIERQISRLVEVEAELKAAELSLTVEATETGAVTLQVDGEAEESVGVTSGDVIERPVRQHVRVMVRNFGSVEVVRGAENKSVEELAAERDTLERDLSTLQTRWGVDAADRSDVVPELIRRITERESLENRIEGWREELTETAPNRKAGLEREIEALQKERGRLVNTHVELREWEASDASLEQAESELDSDEQEKRELLDSARRREDETRSQAEDAREKVRGLEAAVSEAKSECARAEGLRDSHARNYGSEDEIVKAVDAKRKERAKAEKDFERYRLTEEEERVPDELDGAEEALRNRRDRVSSLREQTANLTGQLQSSEGLHARRVAAEQDLECAKRECDRLSVDVGAHRMLLELFDRVRDESVEKSIRPVSELVGRWLTELDGPTHHEPAFGSDLGLEGVTVANAGSLEVEEATSYGEREQLGILVRLAYGAVLAKEEPQLVILDDPLAHADGFRHGKMLDVIRDAARRNLQIMIMTCHPGRFDHLKEATFFDLEEVAGNASAAAASAD